MALDSNSAKYNFIFIADGEDSSIHNQILKSHDISYSKEYSDYAYLEFDAPLTNDCLFALNEGSIHTWLRNNFFLMGMPNEDKSFTFTLYLPLKGEISFDSLKEEEDFVKFMSEHFSDVTPLIVNMRETIRGGPQGRLFDSKCYPWANENFCMVGDAAYSAFPFEGQEVNCGFEDCFAILNLIRKNEGDWKKITI